MATHAIAATPMQLADELLQEMTIEEKAMQLSAMYPMALIGTAGLIPDQLDRIVKGEERAFFSAATVGS